MWSSWSGAQVDTSEKHFYWLKLIAAIKRNGLKFVRVFGCLTADGVSDLEIPWKRGGRQWEQCNFEFSSKAQQSEQLMIDPWVATLEYSADFCSRDTVRSLSPPTSLCLWTACQLNLSSESVSLLKDTSKKLLPEAKSPGQRLQGLYSCPWILSSLPVPLRQCRRDWRFFTSLVRLFSSATRESVCWLGRSPHECRFWSTKISQTWRHWGRTTTVDKLAPVFCLWSPPKRHCCCYFFPYRRCTAAVARKHDLVSSLLFRRTRGLLHRCLQPLCLLLLLLSTEEH